MALGANPSPSTHRQTATAARSRHASVSALGIVSTSEKYGFGVVTTSRRVRCDDRRYTNMAGGRDQRECLTNYYISMPPY